MDYRVVLSGTELRSPAQTLSQVTVSNKVCSLGALGVLDTALFP